MHQKRFARRGSSDDQNRLSLVDQLIETTAVLERNDSVGKQGIEGRRKWSLHPEDIRDAGEIEIPRQGVRIPEFGEPYAQVVLGKQKESYCGIFTNRQRGVQRSQVIVAKSTGESFKHMGVLNARQLLPGRPLELIEGIPAEKC